MALLEHKKASGGGATTSNFGIPVLEGARQRNIWIPRDYIGVTEYGAAIPTISFSHESTAPAHLPSRPSGLIVQSNMLSTLPQSTAASSGTAEHRILLFFTFSQFHGTIDG